MFDLTVFTNMSHFNLLGVLTFDLEGLGAEARHSEMRKRLDQPRLANVLRHEKLLFDFSCLRLFDLEGLGAGARK